MAENPRPALSVIVKCHNEEAKLGLCLSSILVETAGTGAEIIVADAASEDRSLEIARAYPVRILRLADPGDRRCGATAHLGWQAARGDFILLVDGDMELLPGFLGAALRAMAADPRLAAVGGHLVEMSDGLEFQERQKRANPARAAGMVSHITGCALYRRQAVEDAGHFMDRNLHCYEEFELGIRLRAKGWRLLRLDMPCVRHHGHRDAPLALLRRRWRTRFLHGHGEILRAVWGKPYFLEATKPCRLPAAVVGWWAVLMPLAVATPFAAWAGPALLLVVALPPAALLARKRSLGRAAYAFALWQLCAASLLAGLVGRRVAPTTPLPAIEFEGRAPPAAAVPHDDGRREKEDTLVVGGHPVRAAPAPEARRE
mgnify:CR=1 FL=1